MQSTSRQVLMLSAGAAVLLNLTVVWLGSSTLSETRAPAGSGSPRRVELVELVEIATRPAAATTPRPVFRPSAAVTARAERPRVDPVLPPPPPPPPAPLSTQDVAGEVDGAVETRFYRSAEVEHRAEPESEWNLDAATLDSAGIGRLVFDAYVDQDGRVVACHVHEPEGLPEDILQRLELRLRETAMRPATRLGAPVASVQRIEVSVLPPGS